MAFLDDISKIFGQIEWPIQLIGFEGCVINAHSGLRTLTDNEISIAYDRRCIVISGENLTVVGANKYEIVIKGKIKGICLYE